MEALNSNKDTFHLARERMVNDQIVKRGIKDKAIIRIFQKLPRHQFVEPALKDQAYQDYPLGIGFGQTISQPYIVAFMTEKLKLKGHEKILEIGTGCGYQTAVLALLTKKVLSIERIKGLTLKAKKTLTSLGLTNIILRCGDGTLGWPEHAPFDRILIAAGGPEIPKPLIEQLVVGGFLIMPLAKNEKQDLVKITKTKTDYEIENLGSCRFVKLVGQHGFQTKASSLPFKKRSLV